MATADGFSDGNKESDNTSKFCQVCGDRAMIINYGALSCLSCRTFFRRNAFPTKQPTNCRYDNNCEVNMLTRKVCTACRLNKCLAVGMCPDLIRKEDVSRKKRKLDQGKTQDGILMTIPQQSALDLPQHSHRSYLSASDWTLISNIVHAFDTFSPASEIRRATRALSTSASNLQYDVSQSLRLMSSFYNSLRSFISSTPDFKVLTVAEQCSLFRRNILGLLCLGGMYLMRESGIFDTPENEMMILPLYGTELTQQAKLICQQLSSDPVVFKLMLIALAFSSNCYMIHDQDNIDRDSLLFGTFRLFGSQNVYVELIWKYLIQTYGYESAIQRFSTLVKQLLATVQFSTNMYTNNRIHQTFIDDTIEQIKALSTTNDKTIVPLWGRK